MAMASLPSGWEWDYDGSRWLYRYKSTGHVQYHFPKAGDEFPDYVDFFAPVPDLAPEERLESQQQVKRHANKCGDTAAERASEGRGDHNSNKNNYNNKKKKATTTTTATTTTKQKDKKNGMSAVAEPVSCVWEDRPDEDDDDERERRENGNGEMDDDFDEDIGGGGGAFQPESFMFLGPGTYTDVSPLIEEEEEAAKRTVVGIDEEIAVIGGDMQGAAVVSPVMSANTTPRAIRSEPAAAAAAAKEGEEESYQIQQTQNTISTMEIEQDNDLAAPKKIDDGGQQEMEMFELSAETATTMEQPQQKQQLFDPVGVLAEMPTEHTAPAHIETCPDPIEMADTSVLAPIETEHVSCEVFELPEKNSPVERRTCGDEALREQWREEPNGQRQSVEQERSRQMQQQIREQQIQQQQIQQQHIQQQHIQQRHIQQRQVRQQQIQQQPMQQQRIVAEALHNKEMNQTPQTHLKPRSISDAGMSSGGSMAPSSKHSSPRIAQTLDYSTTSRHSFDQRAIPAAISPGMMQMPPPRPPKVKEEDWQAIQNVRVMGAVEPFRDDYRNHEHGGLSHVPSILKPGRKIPDSGDQVSHAHPSLRAVAMAIRYPSILRPGGKSTARPDQQESAYSVDGVSPVSTPELRREAQRPVYEPPHHGQHGHERHAVQPTTELPYPENFPGEPRPHSRRQSAIQSHTVPLQNVQQPARPASAMPVLEYGRQQLVDLQNPPPVSPRDHSGQTLQRRKSQVHSPSHSFQPPYPEGTVVNAPDSHGIRYANFASRPVQPPQVISIQRRPSQQNGSLSRSRAESDPPIIPAVPCPPSESRRRSAGPSVHTPDSRMPAFNDRGSEPSPKFSKPLPPEPQHMRNNSQGPRFNLNEASFVQNPAALGGRGEGPRNHPMPTHQHINNMPPAPQGQVWRAPYPENFGPIQHPQGSLQRSQSLISPGRALGQPAQWQDCQRQGPQSPTRPAPAPAHSLTRIEENLNDYAELSRYPNMQHKRHSLPGGPVRHPHHSADQQRAQRSQGQPFTSGPAPNRQFMPQQAPKQQLSQPPMQQGQGPVSQPQQYPRPAMRPGAGQMMQGHPYATQSQINLQQPIPSHPQGPLPPNHQAARPSPMQNHGPQAPPMAQPAQMRPQGTAPPQGPVPQNHQPANQPFLKQPSWKLQISSGSPRPQRPVSGPPLQTLQQTSQQTSQQPSQQPSQQTPLSPTAKEKGQGWTKWFRSSKSNVQSPTAPSQPNYPPVDIPPPFPGPIRSMTYSAGDSQQLGGWLPGRPMAHPAHHQNFQQPATAPPINGRPVHDIGSPRSISPISGKSSIRPSFDSQLSRQQEQDMEQFFGKQQKASTMRSALTVSSDTSSVQSFPARPTQQPSPAIAPHHGGIANGEDARRFSLPSQTSENKFTVVSRMVGQPLRQHQQQQHQHQQSQQQQQQQPRRFPTPSELNFTDTDDNVMPAPLFTKSPTPLRTSNFTTEAIDKRSIKQAQWTVMPVSDSSGDEWRAGV